jgi:2'-5' RNA ligase
MAVRQMNHFLALLPDHATCDRLAALQDRLRAWDLPARWTHSDDFHLTLCFLGDCDPHEASLMATAVADVARAALRPHLHLAGIGAAGTAHRTVPRTVYAAVADPAQACFNLHCDLADCLGDDAQTHSFLPHLTLARPLACDGPPGAWTSAMEALGAIHPAPCTVETLALLRSHSDRRPRYEAVERWPLG